MGAAISSRTGQEDTMCIFQKCKIEIYTETPQLWPLYAKSEEETDGERRHRMFEERKARRLENKARNKLADPIHWRK